MKKAILFFCICLLTNSAFAQSGFGLKAGANFSNLKFSNASYSTKTVVGVHAGVFYQASIGKKAALQPEVFFSTEGNKWKTTTTTGVVYESQVRVPLLLQYKIIAGFYAEAGPQYSLLVSIKQSRNGGEKEDIREFYKLGTFGYAFGAGYGFKGKLSALRAGLRYNGDFSRINNQDVGGNDLKNRMLQLSIMYRFSKNK